VWFDSGWRCESRKDERHGTGKESWDVLVTFASEDVPGVGRHGLFAKGRFEKGDIISVKWMAEETETGTSVAGESAELSN
jgi:hypothetical protein